MFYIAHRLFAAHDRCLGALVAGRLTAEVGADHVFLPFCDTDEENLQAAIKGRRLFELDRARLPHLHGMLAILHGPSLDDGVCMEIGYAAALGVPVVVLTTDFQTYGWHDHGPEFIFADPLIETVAADTIRVPYLAPETSGVGGRFDVFAQRNRNQCLHAIDHAVARLLERARPPSIDQPGSQENDRAVFVEPSPYQRVELWDKIVTWLHGSTWPVRVARRFNHPNPSEAAAADWTTVAGCHALIADVAGPETPPGAAVMIGACAARGQRALAVGTTTWTFAAGREPNWRNLMIQYAIHARIESVNQLPTLLGA